MFGVLLMILSCYEVFLMDFSAWRLTAQTATALLHNTQPSGRIQKIRGKPTLIKMVDVFWSFFLFFWSFFATELLPVINNGKFWPVGEIRVWQQVWNMRATSALQARLKTI
jgi:hypothetical protein